MVGSQGSTHNKTRGLRRWRGAVVAAALVATACGGGEVNTAPVMERSPDEQLADLAGAQSAAPDTGTADASGDADGVGKFAPETTASGSGSLAAPADPAVGPSVSAPVSAGGPTAQVLAFAIDASETQSYSFEQGMAMDISFFGMEMKAAPTEAFVTGVVDGDSSYARIDMGVFMEAMFASFAQDPMAADQLADVDFDSLVMEAWNDGDIVVVDMSQFAAGMGELDPATAAELGPFLDGPVKIDAATIAEAEGIDAGSIVTSMGSGAQYADPAALFEALRSIDAVEEAGTDVVDGHDVSVYTAALTLSDYTEAMGVDMTGQLGAIDDMGVDPDDPMVASMLDSLESVVVETTIMIDADDLVRRLDMSIDMSPMFASMFGGADADSADLEAMFGDLDIVARIDTWQTFDNYGEPVDIVIPDAVDRTAEILGLVRS